MDLTLGIKSQHRPETAWVVGHRGHYGTGSQRRPDTWVVEASIPWSLGIRGQHIMTWVVRYIGQAQSNFGGNY